MLFWKIDMNLGTLAKYLEVGVETAEMVYDAVFKKVEPGVTGEELRTYLKEFFMKCLENGTLYSNEDNIEHTIHYIVCSYEMRLNQIPKIS